MKKIITASGLSLMLIGVGSASASADNNDDFVGFRQCNACLCLFH